MAQKSRGIFGIPQQMAWMQGCLRRQDFFCWPHFLQRLHDLFQCFQVLSPKNFVEFILLKFNSSPLKIGWAPKGKDRLPTIHFIRKQFAGSIWTKLCPLVGSFCILKTWIILKTSHLFRPTGLPAYTCLKHNFVCLGSVSTVRIQQFGFKDSACCSRCFLGVPWIIEAIWKVDRSCCLCIEPALLVINHAEKCNPGYYLLYL